MSVSQVPQASAQTHPYYEMGIGILDFRESDHTANMSIHFRADFEMKEGKPGLYGMDLENRWTRMMGDYVHQEKNGTLVDDGIGSWVFDFSIRAHAFGASEFYPYDSWMFNLTLSTPLLHEANSTNFSGFVNPRGLPGWNIEGAETFRLTHFNYDDSATVTVVLRRAGWQIAPMLVIPPILLLMLGMTLLSVHICDILCCRPSVQPQRCRVSIEVRIDIRRGLILLSLPCSIIVPDVRGSRKRV